ncbi:nitric oxide-associated protein 1-like isoform X3 [Portunus trituberculatus]|uniref:nitric oxide-associated protein 1-like isoform X3 n=1 Tax=Portunus trituberculatus TaxID=210409 RepID=UPI001E1CBA80|nr:nitric oxide-associated protein 1-like isoform X3 [Portunus trituberculatus]
MCRSLHKEKAKVPAKKPIEIANSISSSMLALAIIQSCSKSLLRQTFRHSYALIDLSELCYSRSIHEDLRERHVVVTQQQIEEGNFNKGELPFTVWALTDSRILYSSHVKNSTATDNPLVLNRIGKQIQEQKESLRKKEAIPLIIEHNIVKNEEKVYIESASDEKGEKSTFFFPYAHTHEIEIPESYVMDSDPVKSKFTDSHSDFSKLHVSVVEEIALRMKAYDEGILEEIDAPKGNLVKDENTYDLPNDILLEEGAADLHLIKEQQGSADPKCPISDIPCGGCGAFLHCQQPSLMGFVPKELFEGRNSGELRSILCQRCYFLKIHKTALSVKVDPNMYEKLLEPIKQKRALVLLVVDLLDVPCSIWPNIMDIIGDIYILGCTNSGKSTLFNALLGSDLCKTDASTLIQRATVSPWPGTTLNMLKFPILRPSGHLLYLRTQRLKKEQRNLAKEDKPRFTNNMLIGTLTGHIGRTLEKKEKPVVKQDPFSTDMRKPPADTKSVWGINPKHKQYALSKWCYDTPGTVQPEQMIHLLTHKELMKVLPCHLLHPETFCLQSGYSLLLAGLARLDLLYSPASVRFTVFRSSGLPLTICKTVDASSIYCQYLGSPILGVPCGGEERLKSWPPLQPVNLRVQGHRRHESCVDVVLSSAGWVSLTNLKEDQIIELRAWSPTGRGIHLRDPPLLPRAVTLRGRRIGKSLTYRPHKIFVPQ